MDDHVSQVVPKQLAVLSRLADLLQNDGLDYWLFGGWAVDFHAGAVTRIHGDIDLAVWLDDRERVATLLASDLWAHVPQAGEDGYTCYERGAIRLEVAFLARDENQRIYTPLQDGRAEWPVDAFGEDVGELHGVRVRVISLRALVAEKSVVYDDPLATAKNRADLARLTRRT